MKEDPDNSLRNLRREWLGKSLVLRKSVSVDYFINRRGVSMLKIQGETSPEGEC